MAIRKSRKHPANKVMTPSEHINKMQDVFDCPSGAVQAEQDICKALETMVASRDGHGPGNMFGRVISRLNKALKKLAKYP